jgi:hypothetical protein
MASRIALLNTLRASRMSFLSRYTHFSLIASRARPQAAVPLILSSCVVLPAWTFYYAFLLSFSLRYIAGQWLRRPRRMHPLPQNAGLRLLTTFRHTRV